MIKKILMTTMSLKIGGAETHILELAKALASRGFEIIVVSAGGEFVDELTSAGIRHVFAPMNNKQPLNMIKSYNILKKTIKENDIRLIHAHARIPAFICGILAKRMKLRLVTTAHWVFNTSLPYKLLSNWGSFALAVSEDIKQYLIDNYKMKPDNIVVTINGIDTVKFAPGDLDAGILSEFGLDRSKRRIVNISRMDTSRSLAAHRLIEAAPLIHKEFPDTEIILVGDGDDFAEIQRKTRETNKLIGTDYIITTGRRTDANRFLSVTDVAVGVSRSALEAMSAAKPVVLAGNEGYIGILDESRYADAVNSNFCCRGGFPDATAEALAKDVRTLLSLDSERLAELGAFGREAILRDYSVDRMAEDAETLYQMAARRDRKYDVVMSGYYGRKNHGDEALLTAITDNLRRLKPDINIAVLSRNPKETARKHNVVSAHTFNFPAVLRILKQTSLLLSGGGTLLQDRTSTKSLLYYLFVMNSAKQSGARVMLYANGIGPLGSEKNRKRAAKTLEKIDLITLRDEMSYETLKTLGDFSAVVTADAVFGLKYDKEKDGALNGGHQGTGFGGKYFCVAVRSWKGLKGDFEDTIARFADYIARRYGYGAVFIPMQPQRDNDISLRIKSKTSIPDKNFFLGSGFTINQVFGIIGGAEFVLGMRLHTVVYAAKMGTPVIGLAYDPKVTGVMRDFSQPYCLGMDDVTFDRLKAFADEVIEKRGEISARLLEVSEVLCDKAEETARLALELL